MANHIKGLLDGIRPEKILSVSEWADENRYLSQVSSAEPGRWRTSRTPYLKKVMDVLSSHSPYQRVVVMKGAQLGFTEMGNNWIGYIIDNSPAPTLMVQPTEDMVKRNSKMRIDPMIQESPSLRKKVARKKSRDSENTINQKNFPGGILLMAGGNSAAGLRSVPIKNLFLDEVDSYPDDLDGEGSPVELAVARTRTFAKRKIFIISTPTVKDCSTIEKEYLETDKNFFFVPCPHCGEYQILSFSNVTYDYKDGHISNVKYACEHCGSLFEEKEKPKMFEKGEWRPTDLVKSNPKVIGFHISSMYSPYGWFSWGEIADAFEKAKEDPNKMKTFVNTILGETYEIAGDMPDWQNIYNKREQYAQNTLHRDVCIITAGVDVQKDRLEMEIVGWCPDRQSYSIDFRVLLGNTSLESTWNKLSDVLNETWEREDGVVLKISKCAIDSGYNTSEVHMFCRKNSNITIPIKGQDNLGIPVAPPRQIDYNKKGKKIGKLKQWNVGVSLLKQEFYSWVNINATNEEYPPCYCHFPQYDEKYFEGLISEAYIPEKRKWIKRYERNEPLDCRIYARAAAIVVGLDRYKPEKIREIGMISETKVEIKKEKSTSSRNKKKSSFWD